MKLLSNRMMRISMLIVSYVFACAVAVMNSVTLRFSLNISLSKSGADTVFFFAAIVAFILFVIPSLNHEETLPVLKKAAYIHTEIIAAFAVLFIYMIWLCRDAKQIWGRHISASNVFLIFVLSLACYLSAAILCCVVLRKIKCGGFSKSFVLYAVAIHIKQVYKWLLSLGVIILAEYYFLSVYFARSTLTMVMLTDLIFVFLICAHLTGGIELRTAVLNGEPGAEPKILLSNEYQRSFDKLNEVSENIKTAVDEQMRSERLKTELITNVSHDIKTPLTSIINYVDLLKQEHDDNPKAAEYLEVLERKSERLKHLIIDLTEASKAETGNMDVNFESIDLTELVEQALGDFDDQLKGKSLEVVFQADNPVYVYADRRHLFRITENLLSNIVRYAMQNTRVYIGTTGDEKNVLLTMKNISQSELNISESELMERFIRGDRSRHTEGSGLGLFIAKSLADLQRGSLSIEINGDLFIASLKLLKSSAVQ